MIRVLHEEHSFSDLFLKVSAGPQYANPGRSCRSAFQLQRKAPGREFSLLMAEFGKPGKPDTLISAITQDMLAEMARNHPVPRQLLHESLSQHDY